MPMENATADTTKAANAANGAPAGEVKAGAQTENAAATVAATDVYAVHGADPEVLAYAMAKYSRSSLTMRESLKEISSQRAEAFLNTFYFQYGHRSIADLAHVAFAVERLSLLAAIELVDEQRWDGQERSTRYQNFKKSGWYTPDFGADAAARQTYTENVEALFAAYEQISEHTLAHLKTKVVCPPEMKEDAYTRTLRARAFDVARYLLPLATNTSLGQIVNARTLETQISRLLSSAHAEVRKLGERLRDAATGVAWNVQQTQMQALCDAITEAGVSGAEEILCRPVRVAPTLVKYATPNKYEMESRAQLRQAAAELMKGAQVNAAPLVDLVQPLGGSGALEVDLAASLLYPHCAYPYRQLRDRVAALDAKRRDEIVALGAQTRGVHDELLRAFSAGQALCFDILMDIGGFRDMHRHRRCIQLRQEFTAQHGYMTPETVGEAGVTAEYDRAMQSAFGAVAAIAGSDGAEAAESAQYLLPLGTRCRSLFKMDFAEALYISELRSTPQGHFSYRDVAWEMYKAVAAAYPALGKLFRITDVHEPVDLLRR
jgi:thymidylate synthase ThyX